MPRVSWSIVQVSAPLCAPALWLGQWVLGVEFCSRRLAESVVRLLSAGRELEGLVGAARCRE